MLQKWKTALKAARKAWVSELRGEKQKGIVLQAKQLEAFIELQANYLMRRKEADEQWPDFVFPVRLLGEGGSDWEWFPQLNYAQDIDVLETSVKEDLTKNDGNYRIVSHDEDIKLEKARVQLIAPGIRDKQTKTAIVKAKISIYRNKAEDDIANMLQELELL